MDNFKVLVCFNELFLKALNRAIGKNDWILNGSIDNRTPGGIDGTESLGLSLQLSGNVWRIKDRLQVHPSTLATYPFFKSF
jgi:hypothetical protein